MTTDVVINNIINDLCQRLQAYGMAMNKFGAITAGVICIVLTIITVVICKIDSDCAYIIVFIVVAEIFSIVTLIYNVYMYIGWKYAPEIKSIEYVMYLFRQ